VEDWAEIGRLHRAEGMPIKAIVRRLGVGRNTVRRALAADGPPKYERPVRGSIVDAVEPQIRELLTSASKDIVSGSKIRPCRLIRGFQAAVSYSLSPPRIGRCRILPSTGSGTGDVGRGGRNRSARCGRAVL